MQRPTVAYASMVIGDPNLWQRVLGPASARLVEDAAGIAAPSPADVARLRREHPAELVGIALELVAARRLALVKFPADANHLAADVAGVQQATSGVVAAHKAQRFANAGLGEIDDLCCGIGGDAMALARIAAVRAVDIDPVRAWMASHNASCPSRVCDVESMDAPAPALHIDPVRRDADGRRAWRLEDVVPGPPILHRLLRSASSAAVKLGPGVDLDAAEAPVPDGVAREMEIINESGTLVQAVLWTGALAERPGLRTATRLPGSESFTGRPGGRVEQSDGRIGRFLAVTDPAIERAGLIAALCGQLHDAGAAPLCELAPGLGVLSTDAPSRSPWVTTWPVLHTCPWREKRLRAWLRANDAGIVDVKTRGGAVQTDEMQRLLRGPGESHFVVFALRLGRSIVAVITPSTAATTDQDAPRRPSS